MSRSLLKSIYGPGTTTVCVPTACDEELEDALQNLFTFFDLVKGTIKQFFQAKGIVAQKIADMTASIYMIPPLFVRAIWAQRHKGVLFDSDDATCNNQLKDIYLEFGMEWFQDPLLNPPLPPHA